MSLALPRSLTVARSWRPCASLYPFQRQSKFSTETNPQHIQRKLPSIRPHRFKEFDIADRVYAITGGGRGLGLAMAEALMEAGAKVYCLDRLESPHPEFEIARSKAEKDYGGSLDYRRIDVRDEPQVEDVFAQIASQNQRLDGLIAAAGINHLQSALEHSQSALNEVMQINYNGVFNSATAAARQMFNYQQKGSILLVASMSGLIANKGMTSPVYNSSKAAVIQLARSLAMEWGRRGIRVNSLCPGHIVTPMVEQVFQQNPSAKAIWEAENMLGRLATPEEFRGAALFALSDASSFMTGSTMLIDGGHTAW
ncbi:putative short chain dehydrogenase/oxidoreductase [Aspergillus clavatus NRRL 1]|uniref:Short chain dehydrogenase/oxidoreductase, putative n=1 Tax=Aspergillus clavatus (strain ATCC 1007 / CBS 513.65 / DSM 816 / NCTC 3887 / NRRL 1 / QM 1276 / 107) TaxID=344612 RepID=A1C7R1_ASPCL|nr:short chain dehydrogenase/oxidoreductase, putative [Aspergillus clavatus NRRL 1]EAW14432.1 short chain dehydrogenase/oxidoreductase, putative [Aspergillus clavatus NRRL 1]